LHIFGQQLRILLTMHGHTNIKKITVLAQVAFSTLTQQLFG